MQSEYVRCCSCAATSSSSSLCRMGPRPVHRPLCWDNSGVFCCGLVVVTHPPVMNVVMSWAIQNVSVRRIETSFRKRCNFPFGFASWQKDDPNVSVRRIEASFRKRCNSLSGLQVDEKAIQTFLCGRSRLPFGSGSRLPFGSGAIPFRVCKLAEKQSKRFSTEVRGFLSEAKQFPFGNL